MCQLPIPGRARNSREGSATPGCVDVAGVCGVTSKRTPDPATGNPFPATIHEGLLQPLEWILVPGDLRPTTDAHRLFGFGESWPSARGRHPSCWGPVHRFVGKALDRGRQSTQLRARGEVTCPKQTLCSSDAFNPGSSERFGYFGNQRVKTCGPHLSGLARGGVGNTNEPTLAGSGCSLEGLEAERSDR